MQSFTILCTLEQTKDAIALGAPIKGHPIVDGVLYNLVKYYFKDGNVYLVPTAEQMISWLETQEPIEYFAISNFGFDLHTKKGLFGERDFSSRMDATLTAIDTALKILKEENDNDNVSYAQ